MVSDLLLYCMVGLQGLTLILLLFLASRGTGLLLDLFQSLDNKIAEAITKLINEGSIDIEPPNPIQALIASVLQQKMSDTMPRDPGGQFVEIKPKVD
jgi:hypothetical protein